MQAASPEERADVVQRWNNAKYDLKNYYVLKKKENTAGKLPANQATSASGEGGLEAPKTGWLQTRRMSFEERKKLQAQRDEWKKGYVDVKLPEYNDSISDVQTISSEDKELELAIQASVRETSHGNAEEDAMIEAAIRESIRAVRDRVQSTDTAGPLPTKDMTIFDDEQYQITDAEYQDLIEKAIQQSLGSDAPLPQEAGFVELDSGETTVLPQPQQPENDDEGDADLQRAIEESRNAPTAPPPDVEEEEELQRAIAASKDEMQHEMSQRTEEDIVMEYVKKQSLAEEEYRRQRTKDKGKSAEDDDDDDEELRRVLEESLKVSRGDDSGPSGI